jgi:hypothetical protein
MTPSIANFTKSSSAALTSQELLQQSPIVLLGVGPDAATELAKLGITTVFDLASSSVFAAATKMAVAADPSANGYAPGGIAGDLIDTDARTIPLRDLPTQSVEILRAIGPTLARTLSNALGVTNLREFALWPPYQAARLILTEAFGLDAAAADPEAPADLVPGSRPYPTERVQYEVLVLDELDTTDPARQLRELGGVARPMAIPAPAGRPLEEAGQLDLSAIAAETTGFTRPAFGALLSYTQSWFPEGLALGQLLHSVALAPGESTRLAMVDWSSRTSASTSESISEGETLMADLNRGRSIGEIVNAVATEAQQGFSESFGVGAGTSVGTASGGAGSADLSSVVGLPLKFAGGSGESTGLGIGAGYARGSSWTTGQRNLSANMAQNIVDRTHQASTLARNRRATIVREVSQAESERVSTRSVTNYNHMHALSVEYFEVVQLYRVIVELTRVSAALFVPMKLIDFNKMGVVARYKRVLAASGLTPQVRALSFAEPDTLLLSSPMKTGNWLPGDVQMAQAMFGEPVGEPGGNVLALPLNFFPQFLSYFEDAPFESFSLEFSNGVVASMPVVDTVNQQIGKYNVVLDAYGQTIDKASPFWDLVSIRAKKKAASATWTGTVTIFFRMASLQREGFPTPQQGLTSSFIRVTIDVPATASEVTVFEMMRTVSGRALRQHLMDHQLYYSQQVWSTLDSMSVAQLLSGLTFRGRPVLAEVDPLPVTVAGNFLVFRKHEPLEPATRAMWEQWLTARDIRPNERKVDLVPLPSGGVFAEAVLGRFNSAEKLDITRFWNWADSPIPITAPEIAAIQMGSRAQTESLLPGQLAPPSLRVEVPPNLPDPEGLTAILQAIQNGNMFRDMSGMQATIGFAQTALTRAFDAARDAAAQAGDNMKTAADIYKSAFGGQGSTLPSGSTARPSSGTTRNASETGALINHGRTMDNRGLDAGSNGAVPAGTRPGTTRANPQALTGQESMAFNSALGERGQSGWGYVPASGTDPLRIDDYRYLSVVSQFRDLITFPAPTALVTAAEARGLVVQPIRDGWGAVNLDRYLIRINKLPTDPQSGVAFTEEGFFEYVRKNFPKFLQPFPRTGKPESLAPFSAGDATSWSSNAPLGSVLEFTIDVPMSPDIVAPLLPELGIVLCTEYSSEPGRDHHWNFSTVTGPRPAGYHPVSGTRQFGLRTGDGYWLFYTRAADRLGWLLEWSQAEKVYEGQDVYWKYFQTALRKFVTDHDGEADTPDSFAERFDWDQVQRIVWRPASIPA